jgi:signal recognition particle receptor subunit beta
MASLNQLTRELVFKIVFYGPGLGGKTTTLQYIYAATKPEHRGKMVSLATPTDRTLYFDFLPIRVPKVRGLSVRLQLFTVPGQVYYEATRKLVLTGVDGVVFVADSQAGRMKENEESLGDLVANLHDHGRSLGEIPHTFHWNKRDLEDLVPIEELDARFNKHGAPSIGSVATRGDGVFEGLERITRLVMRAYEADQPKSDRGAAEPPLEAGVGEAIRQMSEDAAPLSRATPTKGLEIGPEAMRSIPAPPPSDQNPPNGAAQALAAPVMPSASAATFAEVGLPVTTVTNAVPEGMSPPPAVTHSSMPAPSSHGSTPGASIAVPAGPWSTVLSFAELWPERERETVRLAETGLAGGDLAGAVLACDQLVARCFASAAAMAGASDAPRDPALVALLLGLEGARYLAFRAVVRAARQSAEISTREALECFAFAIEARRRVDVVG